MKSLFGTVIVSGSGSLGGHTLERGRSGSVMLTRIHPNMSPTSARVQTKQRIATITRAWRNLSPSERKAWESSAPAYNSQGKSIAPFSLNGISLFILVNCRRLLIGQTIRTTPVPPALAWQPETLMSFGDQSSNLLQAYPQPNLTASTFWILRATRPISPGVRNFSKWLVYMTAISTPGANTINFATPWTAKYGALVVGQRIGIEVVAQDTNSSVRSLPIQTILTVVP